MDTILYDDLLREIFLCLPSSSFPAVSSVSSHWHLLSRASRTSLSLYIPPSSCTDNPPRVSDLLSLYPYLSSLFISSSDSTTGESNCLLRSVSSSCSTLRFLRCLRFLAAPVSPDALEFSFTSNSASFTQLNSITISLSTPLFLGWIRSLPSLKELWIIMRPRDVEFDYREQDRLWEYENSDSELPLESLCLSGLRSDVCGTGWLWRSCKKLKKLRLCNCDSIGDGGSFSSFGTCLQGLQEVELRDCRSIVVDRVLLKLARECSSLVSLLVYDGGSEDGLLSFIEERRCNLRKLHLRLPFHLRDNHLSATAQNFRGLSSIRLQKCCLAIGDGLKTLGMAMGDGLEELALTECDVVESKPGMLTTLEQSLKGLKKLDLSYNEMLLDKEFTYMLNSCKNLTDLKLRDCWSLTGAALISIVENCKNLESLDIVDCAGISADAIKTLVLNSPRLTRLQVDESKLSVLQEHGRQIDLSRLSFD